MHSLLEFIQKEQLQSSSPPTIIAHGGYFHDFPLLLANCMRYHVNSYGILIASTFIDSVQLLQKNGYVRPGLDAMCHELGLSRSTHSALEDAYLLQTIFNKLSLDPSTCSYTFPDILSFLKTRMPIPLHAVYRLARQCHSCDELEFILRKYVQPKTALGNFQMVAKISRSYFRDRFFHYIYIIN